MKEVRLAKILGQYIKDSKISLRELSSKTKVPQATLSSYLAGGNPQKPQHIYALCKYFGCSMEYLLFGEDDQPPTLEEVLTEEIYAGWLKVKIERAIPDKRKFSGDKK